MKQKGPQRHSRHLHRCSEDWTFWRNADVSPPESDERKVFDVSRSLWIRQTEQHHIRMRTQTYVDTHVDIHMEWTYRHTWTHTHTWTHSHFTGETVVCSTNSWSSQLQKLPNFWMYGWIPHLNPSSTYLFFNYLGLPILERIDIRSWHMQPEYNTSSLCPLHQHEGIMQRSIYVKNKAVYSNGYY